MFRTTIALFALLICGYTLAAQPATETLSEEDRSTLVELPRMYRAADHAAARKAVVQEAKRLGERGVARVGPLVSKQIEAALTRYQAAFAKVATQLIVNNAKLEAQTVREHELVASLRPELLELGELADLLELTFPPSIAPAGDSEQSASFATTLTKLEDQGVGQLRTLASLQSLDETEQAIFKLLNQQRAQNGVGPLVIDAKLCVASKLHSHDMQQHDFFSHTSPISGKESFADRAKLAGTSASAENIAKGSGATKIVSMWMNSEGHRANILNSNNRRIGIGRAGRYFTTVFGR